MTITRPIYSLPLPASVHTSLPASRKRKRKGHIKDTTTTDELSSPEPIEDKIVEYAAVLTPNERAQRRLAGQPLDKPPPSFPFPHTTRSCPASPEGQPKDSTRSGNRNRTTTADEIPVPLRTQHLAAMTAILHKCLLQKDYTRAARALALIVRTEVSGSTVDIRHGGLWSACAEILLRSNVADVAEPISRKSFEVIKSFYDKLALQYPWHRRWPNITNAQDFKSAMFALWVYTTCAESRRLQNTREPSESDVARSPSQGELQAKRWELSEAERIAQEMDILMSTIPFVDDLELIRLRGMVALWVADLVEAVELSEADFESTHSMQDQEMDNLWLAGSFVEEDENEPVTRPKQSNQKADDARAVATTMFAKLDGREKHTDHGSDNGSSDSPTHA